MAIKKEDLLKFSKSTELSIKLVEDDSSDTAQVKILHLSAPVNAVGSNPTPDGGEMKATGLKVYVAADNIDLMLEDCTEHDGLLVYKGSMHLDVSKPGGRVVNGEFVITKPSKIWLTKTKFSKSGGQLRQTQTTSLNSLISKMFSGKEPVDLGAETTATAGEPKKVEPKVVVNQS